MPQGQRVGALYNHSTMNPVVASRMKRMLARNAAYRRDMAGSTRTGVLYVAELLMEVRLILDSESDIPTNAKRLVMEVCPEWIGASTAHRILKDWVAAGMVDAQVDPDDRRAVLISPTPRMLARSGARWERIADDLPEAGPMPAARRAG